MFQQRAQPRPSRSDRRDGEARLDGRPEPAAAHHARVTSRASTYTHAFVLALAEAEPGRGERERVDPARARRRERRYRDEGWCDGDRAMVAGRARPAGARGAGPFDAGRLTREPRDARATARGEEDAAVPRDDEPARRSTQRLGARARAETVQTTEVVGGVAPRGQRRRIRGSPGPRTRGARHVEHGGAARAFT